jgi:hypothetical protein
MTIRQLTQAEIDEIFGGSVILFGSQQTPLDPSLDRAVSIPRDYPKPVEANFMDQISQEEIEAVIRVTELVSRRMEQE